MGAPACTTMSAAKSQRHSVRLPSGPPRPGRAECVAWRSPWSPTRSGPPRPRSRTDGSRRAGQAPRGPGLGADGRGSVPGRRVRSRPGRRRAAEWPAGPRRGGGRPSTVQCSSTPSTASSSWVSMTTRRSAVEGFRAPNFELPDLDGRMHRLDEHGRRSFSSPSPAGEGCRCDLPGWQELTTSSRRGFRGHRGRHRREPRRRPSLDRGHHVPGPHRSGARLAEAYAITNVPTVLWIDEEDRIVRPNGVAAGTDLFKDFTEVNQPFKNAIHGWVRDGEVDVTPEEAHDAVGDLSPEQTRGACGSVWDCTARNDKEAAAGIRAGRLAPPLRDPAAHA